MRFQAFKSFFKTFFFRNLPQDGGASRNSFNIHKIIEGEKVKKESFFAVVNPNLKESQEIAIFGLDSYSS